MAGNTIGKIFRLTSFGESHGKGVGGIIDGCPSNIEIDVELIQRELDRRKPGQSKITTQRAEPDRFEILSGFYDGKTTGTPLAFVVWNKDQISKDYDALKDIYRPSHGDFTTNAKYGHRDHRGGGRTSARETIARVVAGAIAKQILAKIGVEIYAFTSQVADIKLEKPIEELDFANIEQNIVRCADPKTADRMIDFIDEVRKEGDTVGGVITGIIKNVPVGLGEPVFDKFHAELGKAMLGINAVKGFEYGSGFKAASLRGTAHNDRFINKDGKVTTVTNNSGGVQSGITNGNTVNFNVAFKPIATLLQEQKTLNKQNEEVTIRPKGRHDPCVLPRAVPIVEAMAAIVVLDNYLQNRATRID